MTTPKTLQTWAPWLVLTLALAATAVVVLSVSQVVRRQDQIRFANAAEDARRHLVNRLDSYIALLRGGVGLFAVNDAVTLDEFRAYVDRLAIDQEYSGLLGIGWSKRIQPADKDKVVAHMVAQGLHDFRIWPEHSRSEFHSILYLEPLNVRNQAAIGFDMSSNPTRWEAMARARDTGAPAMSGRVTLVQETEEPKQPGFLIYVPVYHRQVHPGTVEERREHLRGFVYSPLRAADVLATVYRPSANPVVTIELHDGRERTRENLLYRTALSAAPANAESFSMVFDDIQVAGHPLTLAVAPGPGFELSSDRRFIPYIAVAGVLMSLILFWLIILQTRARLTAERERHAAIREAHDRQRAEESLRAQNVEMGVQAAALETLNKVGAQISAELDLQKLVQHVTDAGTALSGAKFGAFFYNVVGASGESYTLYTISGVPREAFAKFPMPRNTAVFGPTFAGEAVVRSEDITQDPRYGKSAPFHGMPEGHLPVRSYLAAPVISRTGEVLGGLFFGHPNVGVFTDNAERMVTTLAAQAAVAIDNARLYESVKRNQDQLKLITDSLPVLVSYVDAQERYQFNNKRYEIWFGTPTEELRGRTMRDVLGEEAYAHVKPYVDRALRGEVTRFERVLPYARGGTRLVECNYLPDRLPDGTVRGFYVMVNDVSERKRGEQALRESEARLRLAMQAGHIGAWEWDVSNDSVTWSDLLYDLHGVHPGEFDGTLEGFRRLVHPDDLPRIGEALRKTLEEGAPYELEFRIVRPNGEIRWVSTAASVLRDEHGVPKRLFGATIDITDRMNAQEAMRRSEGLLRAVVETAVDGILTIDERGRVRTVNAAAERIFGYSASEVIGQNVSMLMPDPYRGEHDTYLANYQRTGIRQIIGIGREVTGLRKDGSTFPLDLAVSETLTAEGRIFTGIIRDITERKRHIEALQQSEEQYRAAFALAAVGKAQIDPETGGFLRANKKLCEITGYTEKELRALTFSQITHADDRGTTFEEFQRLVRGEVPESTIETRCVRKDGEIAWLDINTAIVRDAHGRALHAVAVVQDVTGRKRAEAELILHRERLEELITQRTQELEESHEKLRLSERFAALGTLSAGLGHDMGNLLLPLRLRIDSMLAKGVPPDTQEDLDAIRKCAEYLQRLANGLRLFALDPDKSDTTADRTNLHEWWPDVYSFFKNALPRYVAIEQRFAPDLPEVKLARPNLTQALFNLVQNAGDAMKSRESGHVVIWAERSADGQSVRLGVTDDGPGMSAEVRRRCMEPFYTTKTRAISTGLGLALVHGIVQKAGGEIEIQSELGQGTTFVMTIPAAPDLRSADGQSIQSMRPIAVVSLHDDRMRAYVVSILGALGFDVCWQERPSDAATRIWVADSNNGEASALAQFVVERPGRQAMLLGDQLPQSSSPNVVHLEGAPKPAAIRQALRELASRASSAEAQPSSPLAATAR